ncbi:MAG: DUF3084 domain-containing protein [Veillonella sp.]|jgi:hypothetical protein|nr:DUF3084 domain-containing protein [Veillonella sp.]
MLVGLKILAIIAVMGGIIAYVGDKIGTKVGKQRMSLFGLRPKYTSIVVTIITGLMIAAATVGVLSISSRSVRTALFGLDQMYAQMEELNQQIAAKNEELKARQAEIDAQAEQMNTMQEAVQASQQELEEVRAARDAMGADLQSVKEAYQEAQGRMGDLEKARRVMEDHIADLQFTAKNLENNITNLREGTVMFRVGELLSSATVRPGLSETEAQGVLTDILNDTNGLILKRFNIKEEQSVLYVSRSNMADAAKQLAAADTPMMVRIVASGNIIVGEPAIAKIQIFPQRLIYHKGDIVWVGGINGGDNAQNAVVDFLGEVNKRAKEKGIIPDPLSGEVGNVPGAELFEVINQVRNTNGPLRIEAITTKDTYSSDTLQIRLKITSM